jgi:hypothetical protein
MQKWGINDFDNYLIFYLPHPGGVDGQLDVALPRIGTRHRTAHWLMREAFRQGALNPREEYQAAGLHATATRAQDQRLDGGWLFPGLNLSDPQYTPVSSTATHLAAETNGGFTDTRRRGAPTGYTSRIRSARSSVGELRHRHRHHRHRHHRHRHHRHRFQRRQPDPSSI